MLTTRRIVLFLFIALITSPLPDAFSQETNVLKERRQKLASLVDEGIIIIQSTAKNQDNLYEYFAPNSDNHDFTYLTGLETPGATLVLLPGSETYPEILYADGDTEEIAAMTGIGHVFPPGNLMPDFSNAYTDYSQFRHTQKRGKPLPTEIARVLYNPGRKKVIYFNYPRFVNLAEPPPERLEFINRFAYFSPKYDIRDASDLLDRLRMYHDEYSLQQLRAAASISGEAMIESMKSVVPGMNEEQLRTVFNFVSSYRGADGFGFETQVTAGPVETYAHYSRSLKPMKKGDLVVIDGGARVNDFTADIQRTFPVSGKFTEEQRRLYTILKNAQEACIRMVKPGVTFQDLQDTALQVLDDAGGYGKYFKEGIGHFLGMDVHDNGDYLKPFEPGIVITVEPGLIMPDYLIYLEDDVLCTEDGYEWLTEFIPREIADIERVMREPGINRSLLTK